MRIISGAAGSLRLSVPRSLTRPTTDRVREAVFSSLAERISGARVLDLYAGSGSLGIEALSRGAVEAVFVDASREAVETIRRNLEHTGLDGGVVCQEKVGSFLARQGRAGAGGPGIDYDLVFADPPYARTPEEQTVLGELLENEGLRNLCGSNGLFILESWARQSLPESESWEIAREKTYGQTRVSCLHPLPSPN